jgi:glucose-6-phosphate 1-dehydrogenase
MRDEMVKVLKAVPSISEHDIIRGQFRGYRDERGVGANSLVETFAAMRLEIRSWRWDGVPFYIRAGKHLPLTCMEIIARLRNPPRTNLTELETSRNYMRFRISPEITIAMGVSVSPLNGSGSRDEVEMIASRHPRPNEMEAYERVLGDAMAGDATLFARQDYVEEAWRILDPVLALSTPLYVYDQDTWGPKEVEHLVAPPGGWEQLRAEGPEDFRIVTQQRDSTYGVTPLTRYETAETTRYR